MWCAVYCLLAFVSCLLFLLFDWLMVGGVISFSVGFCLVVWFVWVFMITLVT